MEKAGNQRIAQIMGEVYFCFALGIEILALGLGIASGVRVPGNEIEIACQVVIIQRSQAADDVMRYELRLGY